MSEQVACESTWPSDVNAPSIKVEFPQRATAGYGLELVIEVSHQKGETVYPAGIRLSQEDAFASALKSAGFSLLDAKSPVQASVASASTEDGPSTEARLTFVALPEKAGRHELTLPSVPISVARASGNIYTLCTDEQQIVIEDALTNVSEPQPQADPAPRPQIEVWESARDLTYATLVALPAALLAFFFYRLLRKLLQKPPPPAPTIPPWEQALSRLDALGKDERESEELAEYFDACTDILRWYLGERYGFDGLESTTKELLNQLELRARYDNIQPEIVALLHEVDLVKFAGSVPSWSACELAFDKTREIVLRTKPERPEVPSLSEQALAHARKGKEERP